MSDIRIIDLIGANRAQENNTKNNLIINQSMKTLYNPSGLGGGYSRSDTNILMPSLDTMEFDMVFETDINGTGYEKYLNTVSLIASREIIWVRYAVPVYNKYRFAYRPCYCTNITKTEGIYNRKSLVEKITLQPLDSWLELYKFDVGTKLEPGLAKNDIYTKVFSENIKNNPFVYPYWYQEIQEIINGTWYNKYGNVLDKSSEEFGVFAIKAPSITVSSVEEQALKISGNSFATNNSYNNQIDQIQNTNKDNATNNKDWIMPNRKTNFKASLENYATRAWTRPSPDWNGADQNVYSSFIVSGSTQVGGRLTFRTINDTPVNELSFKTDGDFLIDTASWSSCYQITYPGSDLNSIVREGSQNIDFSKFFTTAANWSTRLTTTDCTVDSFIVRRAILGI